MICLKCFNANHQSVILKTGVHDLLQAVRDWALSSSGTKGKTPLQQMIFCGVFHLVTRVSGFIILPSSHLIPRLFHWNSADKMSFFPDYGNKLK